MAIVWTRENAKDRSISGQEKDGSKYTRSFIVRTDDPSESLDDIVNACGVSYGDSYPGTTGMGMKSFDAKVADDVGLLYSVTFNYEKTVPEDPEQPGGMDGKPPLWGASSSVTTGPVFKDVFENKIVNSAGDLLEDLEMEKAEFRLTLTQYFPDHTSWLSGMAEYTNTTNDAEWNGQPAGWWKCQGASAKLNIEDNEGTILVYWEVTIEFAYRDRGWDLLPLDIGFAQLVDDEGNPSSAGTKRAQIKGQDGKPVRQPVGLDCNGMAVPAGQPPCELFFQVYKRKNFGIFGQVYTPG